MAANQSEVHFTLIENDADLKNLITALKKERSVAFDLEADSMFRFKERVCLVQVAIPNRIFLIDPLKLSNLKPLQSIFSDSSIQKVFHGADYDVRSLYRDFEIEIHHLFDTEIACRFLGLHETGLDAVIKNFFGVELDKKYQKKDWSQRPLTEEMMRYAARDVLYLIPLARLLEKDLRAKGRLPWVQEECLLLSQVRPANVESQPLFVKCKGAGKLDRKSLALLEELLRLRMKIAAKKDRPLFKVLSNRSLLMIAKERPRTKEQLIALDLLSPKQAEMYGDAIVNTLHRAGRIPDDQLPEYPRKKAPRLKPAVPPRIKKLKAWRDDKAAELSFEPALLLNKMQMTAIAVAKPADMASLKAVPGLKEWQTKQFGREILRQLKIMP